MSITFPQFYLAPKYFSSDICMYVFSNKKHLIAIVKNNTLPKRPFICQELWWNSFRRHNAKNMRSYAFFLFLLIYLVKIEGKLSLWHVRLLIDMFVLLQSKLRFQNHDQLIHNYSYLGHNQMNLTTSLLNRSQVCRPLDHGGRRTVHRYIFNAVTSDRRWYLKKKMWANKSMKRSYLTFYQQLKLMNKLLNKT